MPISALYAGLLAVLYVSLALRVISTRRRAGVALGDGGNKDLLRAIRVHSNFAEYVPIGLILLALAESVRTPSLVLHGAGLVLLAGRLVHAYGVSRPQEVLAVRVTGMAMTFSAILALAAACLAGSLAR